MRRATKLVLLILITVIFASCANAGVRGYSWMMNTDGITVTELIVHIKDKPSAFKNTVRFEAEVHGLIRTLSIKTAPMVPIHISAMPVRLAAWGENEIAIKLTPLNKNFQNGKLEERNFTSKFKFEETVPNWGSTTYVIQCGSITKSIIIEMKK